MTQPPDAADPYPGSRFSPSPRGAEPPPPVYGQPVAGQAQQPPYQQSAYQPPPGYQQPQGYGMPPGPPPAGYMGQQYGGPGGAPGYGAPAAQRSNGLATAGFVLGLIAVVFCLIPFINFLALLLALVGLVLAILGLVRANKGYKGKGLAIAGIVLSVIAGIAVFASLAAVSSAIEDDRAWVDPAPTGGEAPAGAGAETEAPADPGVEAEASAEPEAPVEDLGSRGNPIPVGQAAAVGDEWTITVAATNTDATAAVLAENMFNTEPEAGQVYVMVEVTATYNGPDSDMFFGTIQPKFVGNDGRTYDVGITTVTPGGFDSSAEVYTQGTVKGNLAVLVNQEAIAGGSWVMKPVWLTSGNDIFFAGAL